MVGIGRTINHDCDAQSINLNWQYVWWTYIQGVGLEKASLAANKPQSLHRSSLYTYICCIYTDMYVCGKKYTLAA